MNSPRTPAICLAAALAALAPGAAAPDKPARAPAVLWRTALPTPALPFRAASTRSVWFGEAGALLRYDLAAREFAAFTAADGFRPDDRLRRLALADDERCAALMESGRIALWKPGAGWRQLPPMPLRPKPRDPKGGEMRIDRRHRYWASGRNGAVDVAFDDAGALLALTQADDSIYRFDPPRWTPLAQVPTCSRLLPAPGGLLLVGNPDVGWVEPDLMKLYFFDRAAGRLTKVLDWPVQFRRWEPDPSLMIRGTPIEDLTLVRLGPDTLALWRMGCLKDTGSMSDLRVGYAEYNSAARVTADGLARVGGFWADIEPYEGGCHRKPPAAPFLLDFKDRTLRPLKAAMDLATARRAYSTTGLAGPPIEPAAEESLNCFPFRDAAGGFWRPGAFHDARAWKPLPSPGLPALPPAPPPPPDGVIGSGRGAWGLENAHRSLPLFGPDEMLSAYDPATRRGWLKSGPELQYVQFGRGRPDVLRRIQAREWTWVSLDLQASGGAWWGMAGVHVPHGEEGRFLVRLQGDTIRSYRHWGNARFLVSPAGRVWYYTAQFDYYRFDPAGDKFVKTDPEEEFSFRVGSSYFAVLPGQPDHPVRWKRGGTWSDLAPAFYRGRTYGLPSRERMVRGQRILVRGDLGPLEYDVAGDRWSLLAPAGQPSFDAQGRRVIAADSWQAVLDADPFTLAPPLQQLPPPAGTSLLERTCQFPPYDPAEK